ncbi:MAG: cyclic nucleotide-binding domain-containing protein [Candidatus Cloacimonadaceae bacterium]|jgi:CRP-like cAMP-binding protein|nr:cyclic nucleotide-binding domain-containing protein [Candidatus Cloacimonadota bacterium]MDY0127743.1 cyclic nucleotide-binding domain-containing protein [Candidatus Cloacimonadaceae bacterium]MCB5255831.1 cyclic nucleotide-binding domain-containing protein [Candidatus Cloacimonadota bacterium]MCK9178086.1 cyclic nucleotide-binding domain-containing protein [Candidatus Cloacimonadota bacterium]MCK9243246.1 cyclic nucleotide-binding domain-containing protein [Candidatus Cloacimonadota bacteri
MQKLETLKKIRLFAGLSEEDLKSLLPYLEMVNFSKGSYVLKEETIGAQIFILVKGAVRVTKDLVKGFDEDITSTQKVLATLSADVLPTFGENGILGQAPRNANVIAIVDSQLYTLTKQDFDRYARENHKAAYHIMKNIAQVLSERLNTTDENLVKLATALYIAVQN